MALGWTEIRERAHAFSHKWKDEKCESAEAQSYWNDFFEVFGISRKRVATFERPVAKQSGAHGFIDMLWKGVLLVEHKSGGLNLDRAAKQAFDYFPGISEDDLPGYVVVSDFGNIRLYDMLAAGGIQTHVQFQLKDLHKHVQIFAFMLGRKPQVVAPEAPVNQKAIKRLAALHDQLYDSGYRGDQLEKLLTRLVFCFFADTTGIFELREFREWLSKETKEDGSDLGAKLNEWFDVLDTDNGGRSKLLSPVLSGLPYVNGGLFAGRLSTPTFNASMRKALLAASAMEWGQISPAIFGALFQGLMSRVDRHQLGAHYTRERNIKRTIGPLFMDALNTELEAAGSNKAKLRALHEKISKMRFLDPACGCGNFLVVTYKELRELELKILAIFYETRTQQMLRADLDENVWLNVDKFYGIEVDERASHIARLALWLTDHQMNVEVAAVFGTEFRRLPLVTSPNIVFGNALHLDWKSVLAPDDGIVYVLGNPPFNGSKTIGLNSAEKVDLKAALTPIPKAGDLDFVAGWYVKAAEYAKGTGVRCAFVSTNSITQGEQVGVLWGWLLKQGIHIQFAHRTFEWSSEAGDPAAVHCVIIGFGYAPIVGKKTLYDYLDIQGDPIAAQVDKISPYLIDADDILLRSRSKSLCISPAIGIGNKPIDGGFYLFKPDEHNDFVKDEPASAPLFKPWIGADELINGTERYILLTRNATPAQIRSMPLVRDRITSVQKFRRNGPNKKGMVPKAGKQRDKGTQKLGDTPQAFHVENFPTGQYLVIPRHSSELRKFVPIGFFGPEVVCGDATLLLPDATPYDFGVLTSSMHNAWMRVVCGRIKSDYRYSASIVYNNYPWPNVDDAQRAAIEASGQAVLDARAPLLAAGESLASLYDQQAMPGPLMKAHRDLDKLVDKAYRKKDAFKTERDRVVFLFERYAQLL